MSTSGIRNTGVPKPLTPKDSISSKKKTSESKGESSEIKDSVTISTDGLKLDKVFKDLANVKSFLANPSINTEKMLSAVTNGLSTNSVASEAEEISETFNSVLEELNENPEKIVSAHGNLKTDSVLKLELPDIKNVTADLDIVETFISENPDKALKVQGNL